MVDLLFVCNPEIETLKVLATGFGFTFRLSGAAERFNLPAVTKRHERTNDLIKPRSINFLFSFSVVHCITNKDLNQHCNEQRLKDKITCR